MSNDELGHGGRLVIGIMATFAIAIVLLVLAAIVSVTHDIVTTHTQDVIRLVLIVSGIGVVGYTVGWFLDEKLEGDA